MIFTTYTNAWGLSLPYLLYSGFSDRLHIRTWYITVPRFPFVVTAGWHGREWIGGLLESGIHIGQMVFAHIKASGVTVVDFAKSLPCPRQYAYEIFRRRDIGVEQLERISLVLRHNFFADLAAAFDERFQSSTE